MKNKVLIGFGVVVIALIVFVMAVNRSLPGGPLYGIKTGVFEQFEGRTAGEGKSAAEWNLTLAERRLDEAARAAQKGRLDTDAHATILQSFNDNMKAIEAYIAQLQDEENKQEIKDFAIEVGQALARKADLLATTQKELRDKGKDDRANELDFLVRRVATSVAAAAYIAAATGIEDEAPDTSNIPPTDEEGNPL